MNEIVLTEEQERAVTLMRDNQVSLLTGGPGVGKTTVLSNAVRHFDPLTTYCCAPTGRAAQRMTEAMTEAGLSTFSATTIHSLLKPDRNGHDKKGWGFMFNADNPINATTIIADECSMCDNAILGALISALPSDCRLVLIGDPDQLPPVGAGAGLRDFINSKAIPHAHLTQVHRFAGRIAHVCQSIRMNKRWMPSVKLDDSPDAGEYGPENFKHIERKTPTECIDAMLGTMTALIEKRGFSPLNDIQVLCSRNDQGPLAKNALNDHLQKLLNSDGESLPNVPFRVGDKVMCLMNGFRESFSPDGAEKYGQVYVANGEIGIVMQISTKDVMVRIDNVSVKFPRGAWAGQLTLAYAITVHKAQGGGWKSCIYMGDEARHVDRSLIYTGFSRSKKLEFTIGSLATIHKQCDRVLIANRKTFMSEKLTERMVV